MDDIRPNDGRDDIDPNELEPICVRPNDVDPIDGASVDERSDLMNVEEPAAVGLVDIVSIALARLTAAEPMRGPIEVDRERPTDRKKMSSDAAADRLDRNV